MSLFIIYFWRSKQSPIRDTKCDPIIPIYKKPYNGPLSQEESNIKNTFIEGLLKRVLNDKAASNDNTMAYGYYPKLLKDDGSDLLSWIYNTSVDHVREV